MRRMVLASASPRRKELLALTGLSFTIDAGRVDENIDDALPAPVMARRLSQRKAQAVSHKYNNALIIAADTFIVFKGHILGKPRDAADAVRMLTMLSGRSHSVITGFTILDTKTRKRLSRAVQTKVWFRRLSREEIASYVKSGEPFDKAGAYAIQGLGSLIVRKIEGDYPNVVGLPIGDLMQCLMRFGVRML